MTPMYDLRDRRIPAIYAKEYPLKSEVPDIFAVPRRCSVGTTSLTNGVTVLDLCGPKVKYDTVVRDFVEEAHAGSMTFLPEFSKDTIGYAKTRSFFLVNLDKREVRRFKLAPILEYRIQDVAVIDWQRKLFAVALDFVQSSGTETELQVVDLSGAEARILADFEIKTDPPWSVLGRTSFFFTREREVLKLHALDEHLRETTHPLLAPFNKHFFPGDSDLPLVHPNLPFAVFGTLEAGQEDGEVVFRLATWRAGEDRPETITVAESLSGAFRFSPDGKWLLFRDRSLGRLRLVIMPVDLSLPYYLGPPIILATTEAIEDLASNCAWISDPPSVVCTINRTERIPTTGEDRPVNKLLKWELPAAGAR